MPVSARILTPQPATAPRPQLLLSATLAACVSAAANAGQIDAATLFLLQPGMSQAEVLVRAGPPDLVHPPGVAATAVVARDGFTQERWHYIPDRSEHDPHLTVITMRHGRVFNIERTKVFSRAGLPQPPATAPVHVPRDSEIIRERLNRTLSAAERYAETRARLKRDDIELRRAQSELSDAGGETSEITIYRGVDEDGSMYYGDTPLKEARGFGNP